VSSKRKLAKYVIVLAALVIVVGALLIFGNELFTPLQVGTGIVTSEWELSTYLGGTVYNGSRYGAPSLVLNVTSTVGSEAYMLSLKSREVPLKSVSKIRTSDTSCRIDWGWLGLGDNYMFLTWNGTHWIANTDNGSGTPETTTITGYEPSIDWRKLSIVASMTQVAYYIDDNLVATHTNNIPTGDFQFYGEIESSGIAAELYVASHEFLTV